MSSSTAHRIDVHHHHTPPPYVAAITAKNIPGPVRVECDLPFYDPVVREAAVATMSGFAQAIGLLAAPVAYDNVVATRFRDLWSATGP